MRKNPCAGSSKKKIQVPSEEAEQVAFVEYLERVGMIYHASPNGGKRHIKTALRMKRLGCKPGFPDVMIFNPTKDGRAGLAIEMKRRSGGKVSELQREWINNLNRCNWACAICCGFDEAAAVFLSHYTR